MATALEVVRKMATKKVGDLILETDRGNTYLFGGLIARWRQVTTKKGELMGFGQFDDGSGSVEFVVFPRAFRQFAAQLVADNVIVLRAKVEEKEGAINLVAERVSQPAAQALSESEMEQAVKIFISRSIPREKLEELGRLLKAHPGKQKVLIAVSTPIGIDNKVLPYGVAWESELAAKVEVILGQKSMEAR
jgi:DNA polymerase-3 subunit alpha